MGNKISSLQQRINVRGVLAVIVLLTISIAMIMQIAVSAEFYSIAGVVIGWYFGGRNGVYKQPITVKGAE